MRRVVLSAAILFVAVFMASRAASAQASIAGVVRDGSGAVLPGVIVEASSPALIEKTRSMVTDGGGVPVAMGLPGERHVPRHSGTEPERQLHGDRRACRPPHRRVHGGHAHHANQTYGANAATNPWLRPQVIMDGRFVRFGLQMSF